MPEAPLIFRGGHAVHPAEIEAVLRDHPAVAEAVVVGVPDRFLGQLVAAAVRLSRPAPDAAALLAGYCRGRLAPFQVPDRWLFASRLPATPDGDPCRATLSGWLAVGRGTGQQPWPTRTPAALGGGTALWPPGLFSSTDLRVPPPRRSCGLDDLDYL